MRGTRTRLAITLTIAMAFVLAVAFATSTAAQVESGGELEVTGQLVDKNGNWVADFELSAQEAPEETPQYFPNGSFEEGETGEEWVTEGVSLNRFTFDEPGLPQPWGEEHSLQMIPGAGSSLASVCIGWVEHDVFEVGLTYFIDGLLTSDPDQGIRPHVLFFGPSENPCDAGDPVEVDLGWLAAETWTALGFEVTVPEGSESFAVAFELLGVDGSAYLDDIQVNGPPTPGTPGIGSMYFSIGADALTACDTHGPSAEPGFEGILGDIGCGGSGGQAVTINACEAELQTHGFVHSDAPNTTFLGQVVIGISLEITNKANSGFFGTLDVEIFTPKDVIEISGNIPKDAADVYMSTCDKLDS